MTCNGLTIDASILPHKSIITIAKFKWNLIPNLAVTWCMAGGCRTISVTLFYREPVTHLTQSISRSTKSSATCCTRHHLVSPCFFWSPLSSFSGVNYQFRNKEWANGFSQAHPNSEGRNTWDLSQTPGAGNGHLQGALSHQLHFWGLKRSVFEVLSYCMYYFFLLCFNLLPFGHLFRNRAPRIKHDCPRDGMELSWAGPEVCPSQQPSTCTMLVLQAEDTPQPWPTGWLPPLPRWKGHKCTHSTSYTKEEEFVMSLGRICYEQTWEGYRMDAKDKWQKFSSFSSSQSFTSIQYFLQSLKLTLLTAY